MIYFTVQVVKYNDLAKTGLLFHWFVYYLWIVEVVIQFVIVKVNAMLIITFVLVSLVNK